MLSYTTISCTFWYYLMSQYQFIGWCCSCHVVVTAYKSKIYGCLALTCILILCIRIITAQPRSYLSVYKERITPSICFNHLPDYTHYVFLTKKFLDTRVLELCDSGIVGLLKICCNHSWPLAVWVNLSNYNIYNKLQSPWYHLARQTLIVLLQCSALLTFEACLGWSHQGTVQDRVCSVYYCWFSVKCHPLWYF